MNYNKSRTMIDFSVKYVDLVTMLIVCFKGNHSLIIVNVNNTICDVDFAFLYRIVDKRFL